MQTTDLIVIATIVTILVAVILFDQYIKRKQDP